MIRRLSRLCATLMLAAVAVHANVVINEVVTANDAGLIDENGDYSDWFELYNTGDEPVNLDGWGITDSPRRPFDWTIRDAILPPRGFLTIFASGKNRQPTAATALEPNQIPALRLWLAADKVHT